MNNVYLSVNDATAWTTGAEGRKAFSGAEERRTRQVEGRAMVLVACAEKPQQRAAGCRTEAGVQRKAPPGKGKR